MTYCDECQDEGWVPAGHYEGDVEHYDYDEECRDCPRCACGVRLAEGPECSQCEAEAA